MVPSDTRCVLCSTDEVETIGHFLVACPTLAPTRPQEVRVAIRELAVRGLDEAQTASVLVGGTVVQTGGEEISWPSLAVVIGIDLPRQKGVEDYAQPEARWPRVWLGWIENMVRTRYRLVGQARRATRRQEGEPAAAAAAAGPGQPQTGAARPPADAQ